jgi:hypothetical protein
MVAHPFFCLKIGCPKATVRSETHSLMYSINWDSRSGGFCYNSASNTLAYRTVTASICQWLQCTPIARTARAAEMDHRVLTVRVKNKMASVGSSRYSIVVQLLAYRSRHSAIC